MKNVLFCMLLIVSLSVSGCVIRAIPYEVDRVDQEVKGNRGVLEGSVPEPAEQKEKKTKKMYNIEIELFSPADIERTVDVAPERTVDKELKPDDNKGYLVKQDKALKPKSMKKKQNVVRLKPFGSKVAPAPQVVYKEPVVVPAPEKKKDIVAIEKVKPEEVKKEKLYIVQNGDTLQKISSKMYGTTRKWKKIFDANKEALKSPDKIKPGQKLVIPMD